MTSKYNVSDAEYEVLKELWSMDGGVTQTQLLEGLLQKGKEWKRQTLNTFLSRLEKKQLVTRVKGIVTPVYNEEDYNFLVMQETLDNLYGGKFARFVAAFSEKGELSQEDAEALYEMVGRGKK